MHTWDEAVAARCALEVFRVDAWKAGEASMLKWLKPHLAGVALAEISADKLRRITTAKLAEGVTATTVNAYLALIRAVLRSAQEWGWIQTVPRVRLLRKPPSPARSITPDQARKLLALLPPHLRDLALFSLETGLRRRNVTGLLWQWVDLDAAAAHVPASEAKGRRPITIPLSTAAVAILKRWRGRHATHVFCYRDRPIVQTNTKAFRKARAAAGLAGFRWHDLRHTWASWHAMSGTPLLALQQLGGWNTIAMVNNYAHLQSEGLRPWVDQVASWTARRRRVGRPVATIARAA